MIIKKLIATFGSLKDSTLELKPGLNIIEGQNESGKSTWCAFLRSMLYGIDSRERDTKEKKAEKNRYRPWSGEAISGRGEFVIDGRSVTVERSGTAAAPMRDFRAYTESGEDAGYAAADFGERAVGASREVFERSAFVGAPPLPDRSEELERRILATVSSGDDSQSGAEAAKTLGDWKNKLRYNRRGMIPALDEQIAKLRREAAECDEIDASLVEAKRELEELYRRRDELSKELQAHELLERQRASKQLTAARERLVAAKAEREALTGELPEGAPSGEELTHLERQWSAEQVDVDADLRRREALEREIKLVDAQAAPIVERSGVDDPAEAERLMRLHADVAREYGAQGGFVSLALAVICAVMLVASLVSLYASKSWIFAAAAGCFFAAAIIIFVCFINGRRQGKRNRRKLLEKYSVSDEGELTRLADALASLISRRTALEAELDSQPEPSPSPAAHRLQEIFGTDDPFELRASLDRALGLCGRISAVDTAIAAAESTIAALESAGVVESVTAAGASVTIPRADAEEELKFVNTRIAALERESAIAEGTLGGRDGTLIAAQCQRLEAERDRLERRYAAIELAESALERANVAMRERFSPALNADTAKIFGELTAGRYDRVLISREFRPEAGGEGILHSLGDLSSGTTDQLWLSLRLAVLHAALPEGTPLILDDALITFDDQRMARALDLILRESESRQVLLFTCHTREAAYLKGRSGVNVITL